MFITNNHTSFHLLWKENFVKYQKFSRYHAHDCNLLVMTLIDFIQPVPVTEKSIFLQFFDKDIIKQLLGL